MAEQTPGWNGFHLTHVGSNHSVKNLVNQDHCLSGSSTHGFFDYAVVSDGHSSAPRGDSGSRIACELVKRIFVDLRKKSKPVDPARFRQQLIDLWREKVEKDVETHPFSEPEAAAATNFLKKGVPRPLVIWRMYGATVVAALLTDQEAVYVQLGDGDIFCASISNEILQPIADDARQFANETFSFCSPNALDEDICRIKVVPFTEHQPVFIWLSTDGVGNSYPDNASFHKLISDVLGSLREVGVQQFRPKLERHFEVIHKEGCGDDFSVALLYDSSAGGLKNVKPPAEPVQPDGPVPPAEQPANTEESGQEEGWPSPQPLRSKALLCLAIILFVLTVSTLIGGWNRVDPRHLIKKEEENASLGRQLSEAHAKIQSLNELKANELDKKIASIEELKKKVADLETTLQEEKRKQQTPATPAPAPATSDDLKIASEILKMIADKKSKEEITAKLHHEFHDRSSGIAAQLSSTIDRIFPEFPYHAHPMPNFDADQLAPEDKERLLSIQKKFTLDRSSLKGCQIAIYSRFRQRAVDTLPLIQNFYKGSGFQFETYGADSSMVGKSTERNRQIRDAFDRWGAENPNGVVVAVWDPKSKK